MSDANGNEIGIVPEVVTGSALERIERAQIDVQIATAHAYPRSMEVFKRRALDMATLDEETARSCIYKRPVGRDDGGGGQKVVEGESVRLAEIVAASYGNIRCAATVVEMTPRYVKARGFAHDLETNNAVASEVIESTVTKNGQPYSERQRTVIAKVACAKARRDAIFQIVPKALCKPILDAARKTAVGDAKSLAARRAKCVDWLKTLGIDLQRVWDALGIKGEADIGLQQIETLLGLWTAIGDGDTTPDEAFPRRGFDTPAPTPPSAPVAAAKGAVEPATSEMTAVEWREHVATLEASLGPVKGPKTRARKAVGIDDPANCDDVQKLKEYAALLKAEGAKG